MAASFIIFSLKMCLGLQLDISIFLDQILYFYILFLDSLVLTGLQLGRRQLWLHPRQEYLGTATGMLEGM